LFDPCPQPGIAAAGLIEKGGPLIRRALQGSKEMTIPTNALMFRNSGTGDFNMVYRRGDGTIGWVEPQRAA